MHGLFNHAIELVQHHQNFVPEHSNVKKASENPRLGIHLARIRLSGRGFRKKRHNHYLQQVRRVTFLLSRNRSVTTDAKSVIPIAFALNFKEESIEMSRRKWMALAALLLISSLALSRADDAGLGVSDEEETEEVEDQGPHLVARKFLPGKDLVVGRNSTVAIELYNAGNR